MGAWSGDSKTDVASMSGGDFRSNEISCTVEEDSTFKIEFLHGEDAVTILRDSAPLLAGEVIDAAPVSYTHLTLPTRCSV